MHRSVVIAEYIAGALDALLTERASRPGGVDGDPTPKIEVAVAHRDVARGDHLPKTRKLGEGSVLPPSVGQQMHTADIGRPLPLPAPAPPAEPGKRGPA